MVLKNDGILSDANGEFKVTGYTSYYAHVTANLKLWQSTKAQNFNIKNYVATAAAERYKSVSIEL